MKIKIGMAQMDPKLGDVEANLHKHLEIIEQAREEAVDLLIFPELSLTGYNLLDLTFIAARRPEADDPTFGPLLDASRDLDLVVGFVDKDSRHRYYIAQAYLSGGEVLHVHRKVYLPTYALFDERRHFAEGEVIRAFDTRFGRVGMLICEDLWHASPPYLLWMDGADLLIMSSAHPGRGINSEKRPSSVRWIETVSQAYAALFTTFVVHVIRVGHEDGFNFWGGSMMVDPGGVVMDQAPYLEETLHTVEVDLNQLQRTRARLPLLRDERPDLTLRTLERIMKDKYDAE